MVELLSEAKLDFTPVFVPEDVIIIPLKRVPDTPTLSLTPFEEVTERKRLIINIETTGFKPWEHKIIAIGLQDPLDLNKPPSVIMLESEKDMLNALFEVIRDGEYKEIIGYGTGFDYRFILIRAMNLDIDCKEFYDMTFYDLMQAMGQGKFSFVYKAPQPPNLSELADFLWGFPKPFSDLEMIKFYRLGQFSKVVEFTSSQIIRILALYQLFRKISESPFIFTPPVSGETLNSILTTPTLKADSKLTIPEAHIPETWTARCPISLEVAEVPMDQAEYQCKFEPTIIKRPGGV